MENEREPMINLEQVPNEILTKAGGVPILSYNVPEPTSYTGQYFIELNFIEKNKKAEDYFKPICFNPITNNSGTGNFITNTIQKIRSFFSKESALNNYLIQNHNTNLNSIKVNLDKMQVAQQISNGNRLIFYRNMYGDQSYVVAPPLPPIRPRIVLIETNRLTTYSGSYGAGKTLKTFSLLPGEKTKISIKTYHKTEESSKQAASILDSFTKESSDDFERSAASENSKKENDAENFEYHAEAEASGSWGFGEVKVSGGVKGGTNSSREEFAKNILNATSKHVNKASAKRDVQINTSTDVTSVSGEETEIVREIENINVSRTLNFVFRQMNQEFITIHHLTDVRLGFFNGDLKAKKEFTLPELDELIDKYIVDDPTKKTEVKNDILNQILEIKDYKDNPATAANGYDEGGKLTNKSFIQHNYINNQTDQPDYYKFAKDQYSKYCDQTGREILVPGIILSFNKYVLRTDGVIVDSILGQGDALDAYSHGLQDEAISAKQVENQMQRALLDREILAQEIIKNKDDQQKEIFKQLYNVKITERE